MKLRRLAGRICFVAKLDANDSLPEAILDDDMTV